MEKPLEILVVEDNTKHLENAKYFFNQVKEKLHLDIKVNYVTTMDGAITKLSEMHYDGVISDLFFPYSEEKEPELNGLSLGVNYAKPKRVPIVFVSDFNVHTLDHHWVLDEAEKEFGYRNVYHYREDMFNDIDREEIKKAGNSKPFKIAFLNLIAQIKLKGSQGTETYEAINRRIVSGMYYYGLCPSSINPNYGHSFSEEVERSIRRIEAPEGDGKKLSKNEKNILKELSNYFELL